MRRAGSPSAAGAAGDSRRSASRRRARSPPPPRPSPPPLSAGASPEHPTPPPLSAGASPQHREADARAGAVEGQVDRLLLEPVAALRQPLGEQVGPGAVAADALEARALAA